MSKASTITVRRAIDAGIVQLHRLSLLIDFPLEGHSSTHQFLSSHVFFTQFEWVICGRDARMKRIVNGTLISILAMDLPLIKE
jgi:hypothetical protein